MYYRSYYIQNYDHQIFLSGTTVITPTDSMLHYGSYCKSVKS